MEGQELPVGWAVAPLEAVVEILDSIRVPVNTTERDRRIAGKEKQALYPYYGATGQVGWIDDYLFDDELILLGEDGVPFFDPLKKKAYLVEGKFWVNNHAHVIRPIKGACDPAFLQPFLNQFDYTGYVTGSTRLKLTQAAMREIPIVLAPYSEQHRIAAKLDTTLAAVEACRQRLDGVAATLKRFRQAVLSAATSGELTQGWREENFVDGKWDEGCLHELLSSKPRNGYSPKPADQETPIKSLTLSATTTGRFKPEHFKYIDQSIPVDSHLWLTPGDILIQRANTLEYVGISAIYNGPEKTFIYPDLMMKCQANGKVDTQYLHYLLLSEAVRNYFRESATGTSGNMPKINQQIVMSAPVRWPTYDEQLEIVERAQELFTLADQVESKLTVASTIVDRLTPALLAKAFRGELVPQDPNDEPASELLTKLKANQSNAAQVSPRRRAKQHTLRQTMSISGKDSIKAAILSLEYDRFSFDELRDQVGGDYESLKGILFELLEEQSPIVRQFFDQEAKAMKLERIRR
jgi:type I restriction enzyme S subunit